MSEELKLICSSCGTTLRVDRGFEGMVVRCSTCGAFMQVPHSSAADSFDSSVFFERPDSPTAHEVQEDKLIIAKQFDQSGRALVAYCPRCRRKVGLTEIEARRNRGECSTCGLSFALGGTAAVLEAGPSGGVKAARPRPAGAGVAVEVERAAAHGPRRIANAIGMQFVFIAPGRFLMGSAPEEEQRQADETQHEVRLTRGFYLSTTEVTQAQWQAVMKGDPSAFKHPKLPVERVSWFDAVKFCEALTHSERKGLMARLKREKPRQYRLPTEAEWEYAARAGSPWPFCMGRRIGTDQANYDGRHAYAGGAGGEKGKFRGRPSHVARFKPNPWGLSEMHGNLSEWVADWYGPYPPQAVTDPTGPAEGAYRVVRGGSWHSKPADCRCARRLRLLPERRQNDVGFRVAMDVPEL